MVCSEVERDLNTIWHPFTQRKVDPNPLNFVRAKGSYLYTQEEEAYLDGISSWWVNVHGHAHPVIAEAIAKQARMMDQVLFTDFTHPPAIELSEKLLEVLPKELSKVFFSDNGSTAVEVALKIALQYWHNQSEPEPSHRTPIQILTILEKQRIRQPIIYNNALMPNMQRLN